MKVTSDSGLHVLLWPDKGKLNAAADFVHQIYFEDLQIVGMNVQAREGTCTLMYSYD